MPANFAGVEKKKRPGGRLCEQVAGSWGLNGRQPLNGMA